MKSFHTSFTRHSGFTLAEMIVSAAIMSVLAVGISSAVLVATRAVETQDSQVFRTLAAADVSNQMNSELATANDISEATASAITFTVPDRDGDGDDEDIRYSWSGNVGDPLYRAYNDTPVFAILNDVRAFALDYQTVQVAQANGGNDYYLAGHNSTSRLSSFRPSNYYWICQSFVVALPAGATGWRASRVSIYGRIYGLTTGIVTVELRNALSDGRPGSKLYCQTTIKESDFSTSYAWRSITFPSASCATGYLAPNQLACLVIRGNVTDSCQLIYHNRNVSLANYKFATSTNAGGWWSVKTSQALLFEVYGKVAGVSGSGGGQTRLAVVRWQIATGKDMASQIDAGSQIPNLPELPQ